MCKRYKINVTKTWATGYEWHGNDLVHYSIIVEERKTNYYCYYVLWFEKNKRLEDNALRFLEFSRKTEDRINGKSLTVRNWTMVVGDNNIITYSEIKKKIKTLYKYVYIGLIMFVSTVARKKSRRETYYDITVIVV